MSLSFSRCRSCVKSESIVKHVRQHTHTHEKWEKVFLLTEMNWLRKKSEQALNLHRTMYIYLCICNDSRTANKKPNTNKKMCTQHAPYTLRVQTWKNVSFSNKNKNQKTHTNFKRLEYTQAFIVYLLYSALLLVVAYWWWFLFGLVAFFSSFSFYECHSIPYECVSVCARVHWTHKSHMYYNFIFSSFFFTLLNMHHVSSRSFIYSLVVFILLQSIIYIWIFFCPLISFHLHP